MTTNFPASQDSFSRPTASSALTGHAALHDDLADAIEAVEAKVGSDSSAVTTSHDYKIAQLETAPPAHNHDTAYYTENEIDTKLTEATSTVTGLFKGIRGSGTYEVNGTGHATVNFNVTLASTPVAVFVQTTRQDTTGTGGGEYVLTLPVTAFSTTSLTFRAYEINVANSNNNSEVSTIFTNNAGSILVHASWLVIL